MSKGLSKSRLMSYLQCDRKLWLSVNHPEFAEVSEDKQVIFDTGNEVGEVARQQAEKQYGTGQLIDVRPHGWKEGIRLCREALSTPGLKVLFEAPFAGPGIAVLVDVIVQDEDAILSLIEVKSSTSLTNKPYIDDATIQAWVMEQAGFPPDYVILRLLDNEWVYQGDGDYSGLFKDYDATQEVRERFVNIPDILKGAQATLKKEEEPQTELGPQCKKPYPCEFIPHCQAWDAARKPPPPKHPVEILLRRNMGVFTPSEKERLKDGTYRDVGELPDDFPEDPRTRSIVQSILRHVVWTSDELVPSLANVPYPRYHFDFETISFGVPRWANTRSYQQIPFQWSCHLEHADGTIDHHEFLDVSGHDPRRECAEKMIQLMGSNSEGAVVVYSQSFEESRLRELIRDFPEYAVGLQLIIDKLVDLLPIYRQHYFHPDLQASWSIKKVLPTIAPDLDYSNLVEVQDGSSAQRAYRAAIVETNQDRLLEIYNRMLAYCAQDTLAMVRMIRQPAVKILES